MHNRRTRAWQVASVACSSDSFICGHVRPSNRYGHGGGDGGDSKGGNDGLGGGGGGIVARCFLMKVLKPPWQQLVPVQEDESQQREVTPKAVVVPSSHNEAETHAVPSDVHASRHCCGYLARFAAASASVLLRRSKPFMHAPLAIR